MHGLVGGEGREVGREQSVAETLTLVCRMDCEDFKVPVETKRAKTEWTNGSVEGDGD